MNSTSRSIRTAIIAAAVVVIASLATAAAGHGLQGRKGSVEIGELRVVEVGGIIIASLPPLEVIAGREERFAALDVVVAEQG